MRTLAIPPILGQNLYQIKFMRFGIIRERKNPPDRRVVLSPEACQKVLSTYDNAEIIVEPSPIRVFTNEEYKEAGIKVVSIINKRN